MAAALHCLHGLLYLQCCSEPCFKTVASRNFLFYTPGNTVQHTITTNLIWLALGAREIPFGVEVTKGLINKEILGKLCIFLIYEVQVEIERYRNLVFYSPLQTRNTKRQACYVGLLLAAAEGFGQSFVWRCVLKQGFNAVFPQILFFFNDQY